MEAASVTVTPPRASLGAVLRDFVGKYGLIVVLLAMPLYYGVSDLAGGNSLARLGTNLFEGLSNGAIWALIALGYTLVYGIIELINFAHGDLFMIGSFVGYGMFGTLGLTLATGTLGLVGGLVVTLIVCMLVCGSVNVKRSTLVGPKAPAPANPAGRIHRNSARCLAILRGAYHT